MKNDQKTLLITGATGLIGSHVAEMALDDGYKVTAIVRQSSPGRRFLKKLGVEQVVCELWDVGKIEKAFAGVDCVVHCAAKVGDWGDAVEYQTVNVDALEVILEAAANSKVKRFVHISSLGVYQPKDHKNTDETTPVMPKGLDAYTKTKVLAEQLIKLYTDCRELSTVIIRPGFVYGPRDRTVLPPLLKALKNKRVVYFGSGQQRMDNTYVKNLASGILLALKADVAAGEIFNMTDKELVTKREFVGGVARVAGYEEPEKSIPLWLAKALARCFTFGGRILRMRNAPLVSMARYKFLGLDLSFSIEKARNVLGYDPSISFDEGIAESLKWFEKNNLLP